MCVFEYHMILTGTGKYMDFEDKQQHIFSSDDVKKFKVIRKKKQAYVPFKPSGYESRSPIVKILSVMAQTLSI